MQLREKTVSSEYKFNGRIINLRHDDVMLPNGKPAKREIVEHPGGVCIAALTDENELIFVRQYRHPYEEIILELPAGKLEPGENPECSAKRELLEETGCIAGVFEHLGDVYPTPGYCDETIRLYYAAKLRFDKPDPDEDEFLIREKISLEKAVQMVMDGELKDAKTQIAVLKLMRLKESGKI